MTDLINKIPAQKTGTEFLVASHFTISHEDRWAPSKDPLVYKSTFKKDYPPLPLTKRERIPSPSPATIMHKDDRYNDKCSMTRGHFVGKNPEKQNYANSTSTLTKTNFKMDSDRQLKSFQTTHKEYYPVRPLDEARNPAATGKKDWMRSYIPQGMLFLLPGQLIYNHPFEFIFNLFGLVFPSWYFNQTFLIRFNHKEFPYSLLSKQSLITFTSPSHTNP